MPLTAQHWVADTATTRLAWGSVNVLVSADTVLGLRLWAQTSSTQFRQADRSFLGYFDPTRIDPWLARANRVLSYQGPPPNDSVVALQTPALEALDGSRLVLLRRRRGQGWDRDVTLLLLDPQERHPWSILAQPPEAQDLLTAVFGRVSSSRRQPNLASSAAPNPLAVDVPPSPVPGNPAPVYPPQMSDWGRTGEVWLMFTVRPDGTPDPDSFRALLFDHPAFVESAVFALKRARFLPARRAGEPVASLVTQRISFEFH